ncbi:MAG: hypothetical protein GY710_14760 [Desulfobacteraceae bacterium]|nr:hypothetical protein [Desulfobacteraceae bacterium]
MKTTLIAKSFISFCLVIFSTTIIGFAGEKATKEGIEVYDLWTGDRTISDSGKKELSFQGSNRCSPPWVLPKYKVF